MALIPPKLIPDDTIGIVTSSAQIAVSPSENPHQELQKARLIFRCSDSPPFSESMS